jgi:hypothetical protein
MSGPTVARQARSRSGPPILERRGCGDESKLPVRPSANAFDFRTFIAVPSDLKPAAVQVLECATCEHLGKCSSGIAFVEAPHFERGHCRREVAA